jgi:hypothetical protein
MTHLNDEFKAVCNLLIHGIDNGLNAVLTPKDSEILLRAIDELMSRRPVTISKPKSSSGGQWDSVLQNLADAVIDSINPQTRRKR